MLATSDTSRPRAQKPGAWLQLGATGNRTFLLLFCSLEVPWTDGAGGPGRDPPVLTETTAGRSFLSGRYLNPPSAGQAPWTQSCVSRWLE